MFSIPMDIERSIQVQKPIDEVFNFVADFSKWPQWSPWLCLEPNSNYKYFGAPATVGHSQEWNGEIIGSGKMKIVNLQKNKSLGYSLDFLTPWKSHSDVEYTFEEQQGQTLVKWKMKGKLPIFLFFMKKMMVAFLSSDFDRGLSMMKEALEKGIVSTKVDYRGIVPKKGFSYLGKRTKCAISEVGPKMEQDFSELQKLKEAGKISPPQSTFSFYHLYDMVKGVCEYTAGFAYDTSKESLAQVASSLKLETGKIGDHQALEVDHYGTYQHLGNGWSAAISRQRQLKKKANKQIPWYEVYKTMPGEVEDKQIHTEIYLPIKH